MPKHIVIIGNGISGITCARYIRKMSDDSITVISSESKYFYSRTALMYIYMGHMKEEDTQPYEPYFWEKNRINLLQQHVTAINPEANKITLDDNQTLSYDYLVIATGSKSNKYNWPGQHLKGVQGLYNLQDLQTMVTYTNNITRAVVVGGGLIGIETVEMLLSRNIAVTYLVRENSFWRGILPIEESEMINKLFKLHHVDIQFETELVQINDDGSGRVGSIITNNGTTINCEFVALTVGVSPNIEVVKNSGIETDKGILVDAYFRTNYHNIFSAGDCAQFRQALPGRKAIEQVWYTGKMQGATVAANICGKQQAYQPGHWFNSAKFFDLEYQTYGLVLADKPDDTDWFWWQNDTGQSGIRLQWNKATKAFTGLNCFGIRIRHEVCNHWLNAQTNIQLVVKELRKANFDPEFFKSYEQAFQTAFEKNYKLTTT
ncbi:MAG: NAD(P)/FAD-dependent oxidoreductase [Deinococcales bacterium]|nr:NAD(P)/FAD-dependent oxidoreductase [Chitinophagaceae bacterium]